jgi:plastocyanin
VVTLAAFGVSSGDAFAASVSIPQGTSVPGCEANNQCYLPYEVSIPVGDSITWSNDDSAAHTVTSGSSADGPSGVFDSSLFMAGTTFSHKFADSGIYPYFCMVHPWMQGIVQVGNYPYSSSQSGETVITVQMLEQSTFYLDEPNQIIRASVEIINYSPSDGFYFMKVTHIPTNKILKDFEIYPKYSGNDLWSVQIAYPILESDVKVGSQVLEGGYEIQIRSEYGSTTANTVFSIFESSGDSSLQPKTEPRKSEPKAVIEAISSLDSYEEGDVISITGKVSDVVYGSSLSLRILAPNGNVVFLDQVSLNSDGLFTYDLDTNRNLFKQNGDYTIQLIYGSENVQKNIAVNYKNKEIIREPTTEPEPEPIPESISEKDSPSSEIEEIMPEVIETVPEKEKSSERIEEESSQITNDQKNEESNQDSIYLIIIGAVIASTIVGIIVIKKRGKPKEESVSDYYIPEKEEEKEEKSKWEGI